jgi:hypothetical protein
MDQYPLISLEFINEVQKYLITGRNLLWMEKKSSMKRLFVFSNQNLQKHKNVIKFPNK